MTFLNTTDSELRDLMQGVAGAATELRMNEAEMLAVHIADKVLIGLGFKKP